MKEAITQEQKNKILMYSGGGLIFALLLVLTFLGLSVVKKQSRDIIRLSAIRGLQSDLFLFYNNRNKFSERILIKKEAKKKEECFSGLCIDDYPLDPLSNERYLYTPCYDGKSENCEIGAIDAKGYIIKYRMESSAFGLKPGIYEAAPYKIY